jgi:hypothetical protein
MLIRLNKVDKKGRRIYVDATNGQRQVLTYVRNTHIRKRIPDYAFSKMGNLKHF